MRTKISDFLTDAEHSKLANVEIDSIQRNPDNPRLIFRPSELEDLIASIDKHGVQVPISVYRKGDKFVLIDGERRWLSCRKLGKDRIPALIQEKPDEYTNLLLMFNIHALREQWDYLTIALKLPKVIGLFEKQFGHKPSESELSNEIGFQRGVIRRCKLLLQLPEKYHEMIMNELQKPKPEQKLTEDFFIEMERSLKTVKRQMPDAIPNIESARAVLIRKYKKGIIANRVDFRLLPRIARAANVQANINRAKSALLEVFSPNEVGIRSAYDSSVSAEYAEQDILSRASSLIDKLKDLDRKLIDQKLRKQLKELLEVVSELLGMGR